MAKYNEVDFSTLSEINSQLSMESIAQEGFIGDFSSFVKNIFGAFRNTKNYLEVRGFTKSAETTPFTKQNKKFLELVNGVPFTEIRQLRAFKPEGMQCTYLVMLDALLETSEYLKGLYAHVVLPYSLYLASFLSNPDTAMSSESKWFEYAKLEEARDRRIAQFTKLYKSDSYKTDTTIGEVIMRNADWNEILLKQKTIIANLEAIDRKALKREIDQCTEYLAMIADNIKNNSAKTRPEAAERLSLGAFQVAKEMEYFSNSYYRALGLNAAIDRTVDNVTQIFG
jgi:hypothetical protein